MLNIFFGDMTEKEYPNYVYNTSLYFNNTYLDVLPLKPEELEGTSACKVLETIYKTHGLGEFKKAHFAREIKKNIDIETDISGEICEVISAIKAL